MDYLLDTSTCVFFLRGKMDFDKTLELKKINTPFISEITVFELRYGAENSSNIEKSHAALDSFLERFQIIPIIGCLQIYSKEKVRMRRSGKPIQDFGLLIGATAVANGLTLVTDNVKDFNSLNSIQIENWMKRK